LNINTIELTDCLLGLKSLPENSIDLIVTSPPYNIGKSYGTFKFNGYDTYEDKNDNYETFLKEILEECYRVLKPEGSLIFNHKTRTLNKELVHPYLYLKNSPFVVKQEIIWDRGRTQQTNQDRFYPINELIYWCVKDKTKTKFNRLSAHLTTVWRINKVNKRAEGNEDHPAPFPKEIAARCINALSDEGDVVLDPFMGSGTTAVAALEAGRKYLGFELSEMYIEIANTRIGEVMRVQNLSPEERLRDYYGELNSTMSYTHQNVLVNTLKILDMSIAGIND
jgi:site-specific DNA-methyltransferase (adenine-specific)